MITWNQNMKKAILARLYQMITDSFIMYKKQKIFTRTLQKVLKLDLILQIMDYKNHYLDKKNKNVVGLIKEELDGKIMTEFSA